MILKLKEIFSYYKKNIFLIICFISFFVFFSLISRSSFVNVAIAQSGEVGGIIPNDPVLSVDQNSLGISGTAIGRRELTGDCSVGNIQKFTWANYGLYNSSYSISPGVVSGNPIPGWTVTQSAVNTGNCGDQGVRARYSFSGNINVSGLSNGTYTITFNALDEQSGQTASASKSFTINKLSQAPKLDLSKFYTLRTYPNNISNDIFLVMNEVSGTSLNWEKISILSQPSWLNISPQSGQGVTPGTIQPVTLSGFDASQALIGTNTFPFTISCVRIAVPCENGWTSANYTIDYVVPGPTVSLSVSPTNIKAGESATLTWSSANTNASNPIVFSNFGATAAGGSKVVSPTVSTSYYMTVKGLSDTDTSANNKADSQIVFITVTQPGKISVALSANPTSMTLPTNSTALTWTTANNPTSCLASGSWSGAKTASGGNESKTSLTAGTYVYTITCSKVGESDVSATANVTVSPTSVTLAPDLTASAPSPGVATVNVAQTFSSTISNIGNASTGAGFSNFFQVATASNGGGTVTDLPATTMTTLAANGASTATQSYTFSSIGTYSIRACADKSSTTNAGVITESNENNNCSGWTTVTVSNASCAFSISPTSASSGPGAGSGTVAVTATANNCSWTAISNSDWISVNNGTGNVFISAGASGIGSGSVNYSYSANTGGPRAGSITIAGQTFILNQGGTGSVAISAVSVSPSSGSGMGPQSFSQLYTDSAGAGDIVQVWTFLRSSFPPGNFDNACATVYDKGSNSFLLFSDSGTAFSSAVVGSAATLQNGQCSLDVGASSVSPSNNNLVLNLKLTFKSTFAGAKEHWMYATNGAVNSGWQNKGSWTVGTGGNGGNANVSISALNTNLPSPNTGTTLNWSYSNATSCTITPPAAISGYPSGSGSVGTGSLSNARTYTISCNPGPVVGNVTVNVTGSSSSDLNVIKSGQGAVTGVSNPVQTNINCGSICQAAYTSGTAVTLTATPGVGRIFTGWGGVCLGTNRTSSCAVTISGNGQTVYANFAADPNYKEF